MGDLGALRKDLDQAAKRQRTSGTKLEEGIDTLIRDLTAARSAIAADAAMADRVLPKLLATSRGKTKDLSDEHKTAHLAVAKLGKTLDKAFKVDLSTLPPTLVPALESKAHLINETIALHLLREGRLSTCSAFERVSGLGVGHELVEQFQRQHDIARALRVRNVEPALEWAASNRTPDSPLEFYLHRLRYLQLVIDGRLSEALAYSRIFGSFSSRFPHEIQRLLGCLVYVKRGLSTSPYADLLSDRLWAEAEATLMRQACVIMQLPAFGLYETCLTAGSMAYPPIIKMAKVMESTKTEWTQENELPVETPLGSSFAFHSIFVCPVAKEQATESNPAMMLPCAHVVCEETVARLARSGIRNSGRFKCPYCPSECTKNAATRIYF